MTAVAHFQHAYPGLFRGGRIGWREFWALFARIPSLHAAARKEMMFAELYGALHQSTKGLDVARRMLEDTLREASGPGAQAPPPDEWEALTAAGRRRLPPETRG